MYLDSSPDPSARLTFPVEWVVGCGDTAALDPTIITQPEEAEEGTDTVELLRDVLAHYGIAWESAPLSYWPREMGYKLAGVAESLSDYYVFCHLATEYGYELPEWLIEQEGWTAIGCEIGTCDCPENDE
jgi:hypothetical protein